VTTVAANLETVTGSIREAVALEFTDAAASQPALVNQVSPKGTVTSGALPTVQLVSGTGAQVSTTRDVEAHTPVTLTAAGGTVTVALSPDNVTYSTLAVVTPGVNASIEDVVVRVPAGWYIKLTASSATLGVTTYY
jgi:hypothetical protein